MQQCMQMCMSTFTYYGGKKLEKIKLIPYKSLRDFWSGTRGKNQACTEFHLQEWKIQCTVCTYYRCQVDIS